MDLQLIHLAILSAAIPALVYPLLVAFGRRLPRGGDWLSLLAVTTSFGLAVRLCLEMWGAFDRDWSLGNFWTWIDINAVRSPFVLALGVRLDNMSALMLLVVSLCALLIQIYSVAYMRLPSGEPGNPQRYSSFFAYLSLFTAAMLGLVLSDNLLGLFVFWEIMGLCSYLLIGFYRERPAAAAASLKAFLTTRVGDVALFVAMLAIFSVVGSFRFDDIFAALSLGQFDVDLWGLSLATFAGVCLFIGAVGKSAQFPLQTWLPDAMQGPTPVSALIHAATMVAAGVYLLLRMFPLLETGNVLVLAAYVGAISAFAAAVLALRQNDIKRVLAYSTISQLGLMVLAIGVEARSAAFFHLLTHAIFKAGLFLGAGAIIHSIGGEQDLRQMGGLRKKLPLCFFAMLMASLSLAGVPLFSGFASKDGILAGALYWGYFENPSHVALPILAFLTTFLTAIYIFRLFFLSFSGEERNDSLAERFHRPSWFMKGPLLILAVCSLAVFFTGSITGGLLARADEIFADKSQWLMQLVHTSTPPSGEAHSLAIWISVFLVAVGALLAFLFFSAKSISLEKLNAWLPRWFQRALDEGFYFDLFYEKVIVARLVLPLSRLVNVFDFRILDRILVDGWKSLVRFFERLIGLFDDVVLDGALVDGVGGGLPNSVGGALRALQNGKVQRYVLIAVTTLSLLYLLKGAVY